MMIVRMSGSIGVVWVLRVSLRGSGFVPSAGRGSRGKGLDWQGITGCVGRVVKQIFAVLISIFNGSSRFGLIAILPLQGIPVFRDF